MDIHLVSKRLDAIAEHSMCQPGRPWPHGLGQLSSPGYGAFQRATLILFLEPNSIIE
jgi:hypothetical protein